MFGALKPAFEACLLLSLYSEYCRRTLNRKEQLRHRAVSLRQHGFLAKVAKVVKTTARSNNERLVNVQETGNDFMKRYVLNRRQHRQRRS